jgi:shikimate dehydrogenase
VDKAGLTIPQIFEQYGEEYFRELETSVLKEVGVLTGKVIATGGGIVTRPENLYPIKSNGVCVYIKRDLDKLAVDGRPLSQGENAIESLYQKRKELYESFADVIVENDDTIDKVIDKIMELL